MKVVQLLLAVVVIKQCFGQYYLNITLFDILKSAQQIATGLAESQGNQLTADYYFRYTTNAVLGFPTVWTITAVNAICE